MSSEHIERYDADEPERAEPMLVPFETEDGRAVDNDREVPEFSIDSERTANWLIRAIKSERQYAVHVQAWAACELQKAERRERHLFDRFGGQLQRWLNERLIAERTRRRSIALPAGVVGLRAARSRLVIIDPEAVFAWAKSAAPRLVQVEIVGSGCDALRLLELAEHDQLKVRSIPSVSKRGLDAHVAEAGEIPTGTEVCPSVDELYVR